MDAERQALRDAVRRMLAKHSPAPGDGQALWRRLCTEIGVAGLAIPAEYGGAGAGPMEIHIVLDELGRALIPSPMLGSAVLAAQAVLHAGDEAACRRILPAIASGDLIAAVAWTGLAGRWDPGDVACTSTPGSHGGAERQGTHATAQHVLSGTAHYVLDGDAAGLLLVAARHGAGIGVYEVDPRAPGVTRSAVTAMDLTRHLAVITMEGVPGRRLGTGNPLPAVRDAACAALTAEQVGATSRALELTVEYTRTREQFGRPIGAFQAIQHRLADLHVLAESARSMSYAAARALSTGDPDASRLVAVAKVACSEAFERVSAEMIQLHGGIGITWDHDAHRFFKRAHGATQLFGHPQQHLARLAATTLGPP